MGVGVYFDWCIKWRKIFWGSVVVSQKPYKNLILATPTPITQFISNHAYFKYFLQALTPAPTFTLKLLVTACSSWQPIICRSVMANVTGSAQMALQLFVWFNITLPSRLRHPRIFFATFGVTFVMPQVCVKPITWYIEMHHLRTFLCGKPSSRIKKKPQTYKGPCYKGYLWFLWLIPIRFTLG